jgi:hypothetical protein
MFFWLQDPLDISIAQKDWTSFLDLMAASTLLIIIVSIFAIDSLYSWSAVKRKVHHPDDLFAPYTPMRWLLLSVVAGLIAAGVCLVQYWDRFPNAVGSVPAATSIGFWTLFWSLLIGYIIILVPGSTPPKFRYRPLWLFYRNRGART